MGKDTITWNLGESEYVICKIKMLIITETLAEYQDVRCGTIPICSVKCNQIITIKTERAMSDYYFLMEMSNQFHQFHISAG